MQGGAGGLRLHPDPGESPRDGLEPRDDVVESAPGLVVDRMHESDIELGAVASDQLDLHGQTRKHRQILERASRDDRGGGPGQNREAPQGADRFGVRMSLVRIGHDGGQRAVVVARDQQPGCACDGGQRPAQLDGEI